MISSNTLQDKRILLFSQYFFGYEKKIERKMREMGAEVSLYDEMSVKSAFERALLKVSPGIFSSKTERYYHKIFEKEKNNVFDYVLFIDCEMPTEIVLKECRAYFPKAKLCLHMWDSVNNLKSVENKFRYFDYLSSFDRKDSEDYQLSFRPLFFCDDYRADVSRCDYKYDISFVGTIHSDRYAIAKKIVEGSDRTFTYFYLQSKFIYYYYKLTKIEFKGTRISDFKFDKVDSKTITKVVNESKAVLDIQHPKQTGLTMRTLEMLGMKKKFVTTNPDIVNYDFYDENNICVIDRLNPIIPKSFYLTEYKEIPEQIYEYYSIGQWVLDVLGA